MKFEIAGKIAVVTGTASGIGSATALALLEAGARVYGIDIQETLLTSQAGHLTDRDMTSLRADISVEKNVIHAINSCVQKYGVPDIVVNCAGTANECSSLKETVEDFDRIIGVNLRGTFLVGRESVKRMRAQRKHGRIVNLASDLGYIGRANYGSYCASKGAVLSLTRAWAREFAPEILVNCVAPGPTDTPMLGPELMSPEVRETETAIPLARIASTEEIAAAIIFLCGPGASFITGQAIGANGGSVMP